jgi:hypothetical protein
VHVIQAPLGHASPDTVMIYAKLYPGQLIEEYRKTVRSLYHAYYGEGGLKSPTVQRNGLPSRQTANLRLVHCRALSEAIDLPWLCACAAKKSAAPIFRRMLASHERSLVPARGHSEKAGQIAAREIKMSESRERCRQPRN